VIGDEPDSTISSLSPAIADRRIRPNILYKPLDRPLFSGFARLGRPLAALIRFAKVTSLVVNAWTIVYAVLIVGWQISSLLREGSWPALPLSSVIHKLGYGRGAIDATASVHEIDSSVVDTLLRVPAIVPVLLASALLTAFYLWLARAEKRYSAN
jgi:hypothetical protein